MLRKLLPILLFLTGVLSLPGAASAASDAPWSSRGDGITGFLNGTVDDNAGFMYEVNKPTGEWRLTAKAKEARVQPIDWRFDGKQYGHLQVFVKRGGRDVVDRTLAAPPVPPRPGFSENGRFDLDLQAGDEYGFIVTGSDGGVGTIKGELWLKMKDVTKPSVKPTITGTLGKNGFYTSDAKVAWTVTDTDRVIRKSPGCDGGTVTADTSGQTFTCYADSPAGRTTESVTIKRDATAPALTVPGTVVAEGGTADGLVVDYKVGVADNLDSSPALDCSAASGSKFPIGATEVDCTAVDAAGNKVSRSFEVIVLRAPEPAPTPAPAPAPESITQVHVSGPVTVAQAPKQLNPLLSFRFTITKHVTQLKKLVIKNLPAGSTVTVSCKGSTCPKKLNGRNHAQRIAKTSLDISKLVKGPLKAGTVINVVVSSPDAVTASKTLTVRKNGAPQVG